MSSDDEEELQHSLRFRLIHHVVLQVLTTDALKSQVESFIFVNGVPRTPSAAGFVHKTIVQYYSAKILRRCRRSGRNDAIVGLLVQSNYFVCLV
jgi:hypothetical protein